MKIHPHMCMYVNYIEKVRNNLEYKIKITVKLKK